jgi:succinyl-diaminopimelate desuccinylase
VPVNHTLPAATQQRLKKEIKQLYRMEKLDYEIGLLEKLVSIDNNCIKKKNYEKTVNLLAEEAKRLGLKATIYRARAEDRKPRPNLVVTLDKGLPETLLIVTHYDTVPPSRETRRNQFRLSRKGKRLSGLGVADDKGAIAAAFGTLRELAASECRKNVKLVVACDEEVGGRYGLKYLTIRHPEVLSADGCVVVDSSFHHVGIGCSGVIGTTITFRSKAGHAGYSFRTPSLIHKITPFLKDLLGYEKVVNKKVSMANAPSFAPFSKVIGRMTITFVNSGYKVNSIPGVARIGIDIRVIPERAVSDEKKEFRAFVSSLLKKHSLKAKILCTGSNGYYILPDNHFVREVAAVVSKLKRRKPELACDLGGLDGRFIARLNIPTVGYGPGGKDQHTGNESITVQELAYTKKFLLALSCHERSETAHK